jgi:pyridoxal phosphate-dependent aminotransferase EpsN
VGYNYRLSNVLAAIGRGQLRVLPERIASRKRNFEFYKVAIGRLPGVSFIPYSSLGEPNYWLTCITVDPQKFGATREDIRLALESENIEARPVWKPLHLQPVFAGCRVYGGTVAEQIFDTGLCLPSGSNLSAEDLQRVATIITALSQRR